MLIKLIILLYIMLLSFNVSAAEVCYRTCAAWDTFCKSPQQIVATKCRLGVPVKHEQCAELNIPKHYLVRGGGSLVDGLPCTENNKNKAAAEVNNVEESESYIISGRPSGFI